MPLRQALASILGGSIRYYVSRDLNGQVGPIPLKASVFEALDLVLEPLNATYRIADGLIFVTKRDPEHQQVFTNMRIQDAVRIVAMGSGKIVYSKVDAKISVDVSGLGFHHALYKVASAANARVYFDDWLIGIWPLEDAK